MNIKGLNVTNPAWLERIAATRANRTKHTPLSAAEAAANARRAERQIKEFLGHCVRHNLPAPIPEYKFHEARGWRFDFAWPEQHVALEVEGGVWSGGRHTRGSGFVGDMEKYNAAAASAGWILLRIQPKHLMMAETVDLIRMTLARGK